jgi:VanZ family protein
MNPYTWAVYVSAALTIAWGAWTFLYRDDEPWQDRLGCVLFSLVTGACWPAILPLVVLVSCGRWLLTMLGLCLVLSASANALESWGLPDPRQTDKQEHAMGGFIIGSMVTLGMEHAKPRWPWWGRVLVGVGTSIAVDVVHQATKPHASDRDPKDVAASTFGAVLGSVTVEWVYRW